MASNSAKAVQVQITINGQSLTVDNFKKHVVSLEVNRLEGEQANTFTLQVFDKSAWDIEALLANTKNFTQQYSAMIGICYTNELTFANAKKFSGLIFNYGLAFQGSSTVLTMTGVVGTDIESNVWFSKQAIQWVDAQAVSPLDRKGQIPDDVFEFLDYYYNPPEYTDKERVILAKLSLDPPEDLTDDEQEILNSMIQRKLYPVPKIPDRYSSLTPLQLFRSFWSVDGNGLDKYGEYESNEDICAIIDWSQVGNVDPSAQPRVLLNPSRIFRRIMRKYRGEIYGENVGTGSSIGSYVEPPKTLWVEGIETTQSASQTAADYISNVLCKAAVLDKGNIEELQAGFRYYVDGRGHHFEPIDWQGKASDTIVTGYNQHNSNILSFSFDELGAVVMANSNVDIDGNPLLSTSAIDYYAGSMLTSNMSAIGGYGPKDDKEASTNTTARKLVFYKIFYSRSTFITIINCITIRNGSRF